MPKRNKPQLTLQTQDDQEQALPFVSDPRPTLQSMNGGDKMESGELNIRNKLNDTSLSSERKFCCCITGRPKTRELVALSEDLLPSTVEEHNQSRISNPKKSPPQSSIKKAFSGTNLPLTLLVIGAVLTLISSLTIIPIVEYVLNSQVQQELVVTGTDSPSFAQWAGNTDEDGLNVNYNVYMFEVANHEDVLQGAKPELSQVGPYVYNEYFTRHQIKWNADSTEVTYYMQWTYVFDEVASHPRSDTNDTVVQANLVAMGLRTMVQGMDSMIETKIQTWISNQSAVIQPILHKLLDDEDPADLITKAAICLTSGKDAMGPFHRRSPRDLYFGYNNDPTLAKIKNLLPAADAKTFSTYAPGLSNNYTDEADVMRRDNTWTTYTGKDDIKKLGKYKYYANMTEMYVCVDYTFACDGVIPPSPDLDAGEIPVCHKFQYDWTDREIFCHGYVPMFNGYEANKIEGTDATQSGDLPVRGDYMQVFISDLYRSSRLKYFGDVDDWHGITLRRYGIDPTDLLNADSDPSQADFYQFAYNGMENMSTAAGFPLFASKPHYLDADDEALLSVVGMNPDPKLHDTYVDYEPNTGVAMRAAKRLQINTVLYPLPVLRSGTVENYELRKHWPNYTDVFDCLEMVTDGTQETYTPYAWTDEFYTYSDDDADEFKDVVLGTQNLAVAVSIYSAIAAGTFFVCFGWTYLYRKKVKREERESLALELTEKEQLILGSDPLTLSARHDTVTF
ncbi:hypothetical protein TL16_g03699 [Triparma laevis f. inornata]|uniref:Uncharacterized protein n=2 Tax=Triparma laevis TaxID=1534972 RepID=A0A9W7KW92_9STRA|nr:hypothetical protein TL16_g03699 [Triparma laevis f. inornata]GMI13819.1 hypothetical protein TrLO_g935 [Triparma laevis f. longispina]